MIDKKCSICQKKGYVYLNGSPLCLFHDVKNYWKSHRGCLENHLDSFVEYLERHKKLDRDMTNFLKEIKVQIREMVKEFPILFKKLK